MGNKLTNLKWWTPDFWTINRESSSTEAATFFFGSIFRLTAASHLPHWCTLRTWEAPKMEGGRFEESFRFLLERSMGCFKFVAFLMIYDMISKHKLPWFLMISNLEIGNNNQKTVCVWASQLVFTLHRVPEYCSVIAVSWWTSFLRRWGGQKQKTFHPLQVWDGDDRRKSWSRKYGKNHIQMIGVWGLVLQVQYLGGAVTMT